MSSFLYGLIKIVKKTILATGGAGFIGANFIYAYREKYPDAVVNLDKLTYAGNYDNLAPLNGSLGYIFIKGDIGDKELIAKLLIDYKPWAIINFAAESHVDRSISAPDAFIQTNVIGTFNLLQEVHYYWKKLSKEKQSNFRFLHVSTDEVYGSLKNGDSAFTEATAYSPNSPYSASKAASDHLVRAYHHTYGLPTLTTNCSNNYGPYQFPEKLIPLVIHQALSNRKIPVYGDGSNIRDWLYVKDHCNGIIAVLLNGRPGQVYNIGGNNEKTNIEVVRTICALLDVMSPHADRCRYDTLIEFIADRPGHDRRYAIDASKMKREIGWTPEESFQTGIFKTVQWYLDNQQWVNNVATGEYQEWMKRNYN